MNFNEIIQRFQAEMLSKGIKPPATLVVNGQLQRFNIEGDQRGTKNGWYMLFIDNVPCGAFGSWKLGASHKWCAKRREQMSGSEFLILQKQIEEAQKQRNAERTREQAKAAKLAEHLYSKSLLADPNHLYLVSKHIGSFYARQRGSYLVLPIIDLYGNFCSLQHIAPDGSKRFLPNGAINGHFIPVQSRPADGIKILICESFSTGGTLAEASPNACVVAACCAGNLKAVALEIRRYLPNAHITICADDDRLKPINTGLVKGREAAIAAGTFFAKPCWPAGSPKALSDFNDLATWISSKRIAA
jgi:putative DNA primase/helicase